MNQHVDYQKMISRELDQELTDRDRRDLEEHLQGCAECCRVRDQLRAVSAMVRTDTLFTTSVGLSSRIVSHVEREVLEGVTPALRPGKVPGRLVALRRSAAAAAVVLLFLGGLHVSRFPGEARAEDPTEAVDAPAAEFQPEQEFLEIIKDEGDDEAENTRYLGFFVPGKG